MSHQDTCFQNMSHQDTTSFLCELFVIPNETLRCSFDLRGDCKFEAHCRFLHVQGRHSANSKYSKRCDDPDPNFAIWSPVSVPASINKTNAINAFDSSTTTTTATKPNTTTTNNAFQTWNQKMKRFYEPYVLYVCSATLLGKACAFPVCPFDHIKLTRARFKFKIPIEASRSTPNMNISVGNSIRNETCAQPWSHNPTFSPSQNCNPTFSQHAPTFSQSQNCQSQKDTPTLTQKHTHEPHLYDQKNQIQRSATILDLMAQSNPKAFQSTYGNSQHHPQQHHQYHQQKYQHQYQHQQQQQECPQEQPQYSIPSNVGTIDPPNELNGDAFVEQSKYTDHAHDDYNDDDNDIIDHLSSYLKVLSPFVESNAPNAFNASNASNALNITNTTITQASASFASVSSSASQTVPTSTSSGRYVWFIDDEYKKNSQQTQTQQIQQTNPPKTTPIHPTTQFNSYNHPSSKPSNNTTHNTSHNSSNNSSNNSNNTSIEEPPFILSAKALAWNSKFQHIKPVKAVNPSLITLLEQTVHDK